MPNLDSEKLSSAAKYIFDEGDLGYDYAARLVGHDVARKLHAIFMENERKFMEKTNNVWPNPEGVKLLLLHYAKTYCANNKNNYLLVVEAANHAVAVT